MFHNDKLFVVLVIALVSVVIFSIFSCSQYEDLLGVNSDLLGQIDSQSEQYADLQRNCANLEKENNALKKRVSLPEYSFTKEEIRLLAVCVQCEAGEENTVAQKYSAAVILNRVKSGYFADTVEEVIYEKVNGVPQFSVAYNGMMEECTLSDKVLANVYSVIVNGTDLPEYVMYFYDSHLKEDNWVKSLPVYDIVEGTVLAYEKEDKDKWVSFQ